MYVRDCAERQQENLDGGIDYFLCLYLPSWAMQFFSGLSVCQGRRRVQRQRGVVACDTRQRVCVPRDCEAVGVSSLQGDSCVDSKAQESRIAIMHKLSKNPHSMNNN